MSFLQKISISIVAVLFSIVIVLDLFIQPEYHYDDYPYFDCRSGLLLVSILVVGGIIIGVIAMGKILKWNPIFPLMLYIIMSLTFLFLVPMVPVSDQKIVFDLATNNLADPNEYMVVNVNVIPTILYVYGVVGLLGKSLWAQKIANMICGIITLIITAKMCGLLADGEVEQRKASRLYFSLTECKLLWIGALFLPALFYNNHIYNEVPSVTLAVMMLYLVIRNDDKVIIRVVTIIVSCLQFVLRQSGIILVIAAAMYIFFYQKKKLYALVYLASVVLVYLLVEKWYTAVIVGDGAQGYPVWSFIRMGINEAEFGFQDHSHTSDASFQDCVDAYKKLGPVKVLTIFAKKIFWIWGEGTYQSGRYGLGYPENDYLYNTIVTDYVSETADRKLRIAINMILRAQYLFYMLFAVFGTLRARKKPELSIFLFIICGFFLFFIVWEIKSRYLYGLYPVFWVLALNGYEWSKEPLVKIVKAIKCKALKGQIS